MSYFIIIRGPAGVGKTTTARKLAKLLDAYHISIDSILAKHNLDDLDYVSGNLCVPECKMLAANRIIIPTAQEKLEAGQIVVFDGNFYHKSQIEDLINQLQFPYSIYTLKTDLEKCLIQNKQRPNPLDDQAVKDVFELVSQFDYGNVINVNVQTIDETASKIANQKGFLIMNATQQTKIDFSRWLSTKLYLINVGIYVTIGLIMLLPAILTTQLEIPLVIASFSVFFVVLFFRAAYESLIVYDASLKSLSLHKMLILTLVTSGLISFVSVFLKPKLGYFSIPVSLIISMIVVGKLKTALWQTTQRSGFFTALPAKLELASWGRYGFYVFLVGITYIAYAKYGLNFMYAFAAGFFIGMMFEESYNLIKLYEQKLTTKTLVAMIIWSLICAITSTAIVIVMMKQFSYSGQAATIASVLLLKLIQPFGSRKFIFGL